MNLEHQTLRSAPPWHGHVDDLAWQAGLPPRGPQRWLACHGGGGGKSSSGNTTQTSTNKQVGASDNATAMAFETGDAADIDVALQNLSPEVIAAVTDRLTDFASGVAENALSANAQVMRGVLADNESFMAQTQAGVGQLVAGNLETLSDLAKSTTTGGLSDANRNLLILGLGAVAALALGAAAIAKAKA